MSDIVDRLRAIYSAAINPDIVLYKEAADEIEHLRALCGAASVSDGFRELTKDAKREVVCDPGIRTSST